MSTDDVSRATLAEVRALAAEHGWSRVAEFTATIPDPEAREIAILAAEGVDPGPLAAWVAELGAAGTARDALEPLAERPWRSLAPNRVVVVLRCGRLLTAGTARAASVVTARPLGTYCVVLTGAEEVASAEELASVERGLWRVLLQPGGAEWHGQDIAALGCLLWSGEQPGGWLSDRVGRDVAALREWLTGAVSVPAELDRERAVAAVSLAMDALNAARPAVGAEGALEARRLADQVATVRGLHSTLVSRLDSDAAATQRQVLASLEVLALGTEPTADRMARSIQAWAAETEQVIWQRETRARQDAMHLLDRADWDVVNEVMRDPGQGYPNVILDELAPQPISLPPDSLPVGADAHASQNRSPVVGAPLVTAGVGAVVLGVLGLPLVPVAGAAALGVIGGSVYAARQRADQAHKQQVASGSIASAVAAVRQLLSDRAAVRRSAVDGLFIRLERALDERARDATQSARTDTSASSRDESLRARLVMLAENLT